MALEYLSNSGLGYERLSTHFMMLPLITCLAGDGGVRVLCGCDNVNGLYAIASDTGRSDRNLVRVERCISEELYRRESEIV